MVGPTTQGCSRASTSIGWIGISSWYLSSHNGIIVTILLSMKEYYIKLSTKLLSRW